MLLTPFEKLYFKSKKITQEHLKNLSDTKKKNLFDKLEKEDGKYFADAETVFLLCNLEYYLEKEYGNTDWRFRCAQNYFVLEREFNHNEINLVPEGTSHILIFKTMPRKIIFTEEQIEEIHELANEKVETKEEYVNKFIKYNKIIDKALKETNQFTKNKNNE